MIGHAEPNLRARIMAQAESVAHRNQQRVLLFCGLAASVAQSLMHLLIGHACALQLFGAVLIGPGLIDDKPLPAGELAAQRAHSGERSGWPAGLKD